MMFDIFRVRIPKEYNKFLTGRRHSIHLGPPATEDGTTGPDGSHAIGGRGYRDRLSLLDHHLTMVLIIFIDAGVLMVGWGRKEEERGRVELERRRGRGEEEREEKKGGGGGGREKRKAEGAKKRRVYGEVAECDDGQAGASIPDIADGACWLCVRHLDFIAHSDKP